MTKPEITPDEIADFCERLAELPGLKLDDTLIIAEDCLANEGGSARAKMILDGMRAGIQQAKEADAGQRVIAIWFDDNSARVMLSWDGNESPGQDLRRAIEQTVASAMRPNGD